MAVALSAPRDLVENRATCTFSVWEIFQLSLSHATGIDSPKFRMKITLMRKAEYGSLDLPSGSAEPCIQLGLALGEWSLYDWGSGQVRQHPGNDTSLCSGIMQRSDGPDRAGQ